MYIFEDFSTRTLALHATVHSTATAVSPSGKSNFAVERSYSSQYGQRCTAPVPYELYYDLRSTVGLLHFYAGHDPSFLTRTSSYLARIAELCVLPASVH